MGLEQASERGVKKYTGQEGASIQGSSIQCSSNSENFNLVGSKRSSFLPIQASKRGQMIEGRGRKKI